MKNTTAPSTPQVATILRSYDASPAALDAFKTARASADGTTPEDFAALLAREGHPDDAVEFLARWLPARQGVWWCCLALWDTFRPEPPASVDAALCAIVRWVEDPSEENRRAVQLAGKSLGPRHPVGALSLAAFWSSGSMSEPGLPEVAPPANLSSQVIAAALNVAVQRQPVGRGQELYQLFTRLGLEVAAEPAHWELAALDQER